MLVGSQFCWGLPVKVTSQMAHLSGSDQLQSGLDYEYDSALGSPSIAIATMRAVWPANACP